MIDRYEAERIAEDVMLRERRRLEERIRNEIEQRVSAEDTLRRRIDELEQELRTHRYNHAESL